MKRLLLLSILLTSNAYADSIQDLTDAVMLNGMRKEGASEYEIRARKQEQMQEKQIRLMEEQNEHLADMNQKMEDEEFDRTYLELQRNWDKRRSN